jgi:hypothetical protein
LIYTGLFRVIDDQYTLGNRHSGIASNCPFPALTCPSKHVRIRALAAFDAVSDWR